MVTGARLAKEIVVTVVNKIGILADMSKLLSERGINISAVSGYAAGNKEAKIMIVTEDNLRAKEALQKAGYNSLAENDVILLELENKVGALKLVSAKLAAEEIDIKQVYGTACAGGCPAMLVLSTTDNDKALVAFKK